ncbi:hypothetical protein EJB05_27017, partial [Eragrostis curvula]
MRQAEGAPSHRRGRARGAVATTRRAAGWPRGARIRFRAGVAGQASRRRRRLQSPARAKATGHGEAEAVEVDEVAHELGEAEARGRGCGGRESRADDQDQLAVQFSLLATLRQDWDWDFRRPLEIGCFGSMEKEGLETNLTFCVLPSVGDSLRRRRLGSPEAKARRRRRRSNGVISSDDDEN